MIMNASGIALLKEFEGFREKAYKDMVNVTTIGYGFTKGVKMGDRMTLEEAEERLRTELIAYEVSVQAACTVPANENQFAAMVCLAWNIGVEGFRKSTVLKAHNRGDFDAAARAFGLWNKAGGRVVQGLVRRRAAEAALYLKPMSDIPLQMPQKVDSESGARHSPIIWSGGITGAVSTVQATTTLIDSGKTLKEQLGDLLPWVVVAVLAGVVVWNRIAQRRSGNS